MINFLGKTSKLQQFKNKSAQALNIFSDTIANLSALSKEIDEEQAKTEVEIAEQTAYLTQLKEEKSSATNIISKIEAIIK